MISFKKKTNQSTAAQLSLHVLSNTDQKVIELHNSITQGSISSNTDLINGIDPRTGNTALHCAIKHHRTLTDPTALGQNLSIIKKLIELGADLKAKDKDGNTPLHLAAMIENGTVTQILLEKIDTIEKIEPAKKSNSYLAAENNQKRTPLQVAAGDYRKDTSHQKLFFIGNPNLNKNLGGLGK